MRRLSDFAHVSDLNVLQDGTFSTMGFIDSPQPGLLVFADQKRFLDKAHQIEDLGGVVTTPCLAKQWRANCALAEVDNPRLAFFQLHNYLASETDFYWSSFPTEIHPSAIIHPKAFINPTDVRVGPRCRIEANATLMPRVELHEDTVVLPGAVIGSEGLQRTVIGESVVDLIHAGSVEIGKQVRILANAVVAAGVFRQVTRIGDGTRIGSQSFISHNVEIRERCVIGHGAVIAGNCILERDVTIGPGSTVINCIEIGERAYVTSGATVVQSVEPGHRVSGGFALEHRKYLRFLNTIR